MFQVSGAKWQYAARAAVMTMMGSFGGGCFGLIFTLVKNKGRADVMELINGILGSLVSVTAGCFLYRAWEALLIGVIGAAIASATTPLFDKLRIDDPVGASAVHGACGVWGELMPLTINQGSVSSLEASEYRAGLNRLPHSDELV
ncbi:unnamed protein product [Plutella xylostella]|uniref:(diamondback moth) hypothetical protein n=1 Tax=Plutella xylostella TaxID=51655 RepID=A0A8S4G443_PLUXY|nr:unnamed protein product [Plutella xylostella]